MWNWDIMKEVYYATNKKVPNALFECTLSDLLKIEDRQQLLSIYGNGIGALRKNVTVMYLAGWFGYLGGALHHLFIDGKELNFKAPLLQVLQTEKSCWISFCISDASIVPATKDLSYVYTKWMAPIMLELAKEINSPILPLWYQYYHSFYWIKHRLKRTNMEITQKNKYIDALNQFEKTSPVHLFQTKTHPFQKPFIFVDNPWELSDPLPLKPSCCLAFDAKRGNGHKCYTCPRMKKEIREQKKEQILINRG